MRRLIPLMILGCLLFASAAFASPGAFTLPESQILGHFGVEWFTTSRLYDDEGKVTQGDSDLLYQQIIGLARMRIGVAEDLEIGFLLPMGYQKLKNDFNEETNWALGDLEFDTAYVMVGGRRAALTIDGLIKLPFFYRANRDLPAGDGQIDLQARLLGAVRVSLFTLGIDGGYRYRFGAPSDEWRYGAEVAFAYNIVYGKARLNGIASARNADEDAYWAPLSQSDDEDARKYFKHGPDFALMTMDYTLGLMFASYIGMEAELISTLMGRNAAEGTTLLLSIVYSF